MKKINYVTKIFNARMGLDFPDSIKFATNDEAFQSIAEYVEKKKGFGTANQFLRTVNKYKLLGMLNDESKKRYGRIEESIREIN